MALNHTSGLPNWATPALNGLRVDGALADGTALPPLQFEQAVSAFSLQTTARDYGTFVAALLKDDSMLQQIVERPVPMAPGLGVRWGLGWGLA